MLKKIISFILIFVFTFNASPLCFAAKSVSLKELPPVSSMSQKDKMDLIKRIMYIFEYSEWSPREKNLDEILDVMRVYFSEYDYKDNVSYGIGKEIMDSYIRDYPFDYEIMKKKLKEKNKDFELMKYYAKTAPEDLPIVEEALSLGYLEYDKRYRPFYKDFVEISRIINQDGLFTQTQKTQIFESDASSEHKVLIVKKTFNDKQIPNDKKFDKIIKTLECMDYHKNNFLITIDKTHTEQQLRENFNRISEIYKESYNVYEKNQKAEKYYATEILKIFFSKFSNADNMSSDEFIKINKLGSVMPENTNENNYEFIKSKLENENTDLQQLSNVIDYITFNTKPTESFFKAFDKGYIQSIIDHYRPYYSGLRLSTIEEEYMNFIDCMEKDQSFNNEQINKVLSFDLKIEYKTKIVNNTVVDTQLTSEKKNEIINKKMEKKAKSYSRNKAIKDVILCTVATPFLVAILILPWSGVYAAATYELKERIKKKGIKGEPGIIYQFVLLGITALSPFNLLNFIDLLHSSIIKPKD